MTGLLHKEITGAIIGAYYEVYNHTSRLLPEHLYERAMLQELRHRGLPTVRQDEYRITYKDHLVGVQQLDLFVVKEVVVENKVVGQLAPLHKAQALSYLKTVGKTVGLLLNFGGKAPEFDRLYFDPSSREPTAAHDQPGSAATPSADWLHPDLVYSIVGGLYEVHYVLGPGFVYRIYANACYRELGLRGLGVKPGHRMQVTYKDTVIGDVGFAHLVVEGKVMVFPVALNDTRAIRLDSLKAWLRTSGLQLGILANFNSVPLDVTFVRAG